MKAFFCASTKTLALLSSLAASVLLVGCMGARYGAQQSRGVVVKPVLPALLQPHFEAQDADSAPLAQSQRDSVVSTWLQTTSNAPK